LSGKSGNYLERKYKTESSGMQPLWYKHLLHFVEKYQGTKEKKNPPPVRDGLELN
jgi:hypothetical protein